MRDDEKPDKGMPAFFLVPSGLATPLAEACDLTAWLMDSMDAKTNAIRSPATAGLWRTRPDRTFNITHPTGGSPVCCNGWLARLLRCLLPLVCRAKSICQLVRLDLVGIELVDVLVGYMQLPFPNISPMLPLGIVRMSFNLV